MYDKRPFVQVSPFDDVCCGWEAIALELRSDLTGRARAVLGIEAYPGAFVYDIGHSLGRILNPALMLFSEDSFLSSAEIDGLIAPWLTDDPVFGRLGDLSLQNFFDPEKLMEARNAIGKITDGLVLVVGTGASIVAEEHDLLVYADMARWEIQQRQRRGETANLGGSGADELASVKYKRSFFIDWPICDRLKRQLFSSIDYLLDTNDAAAPKLLSGPVYREGLRKVVERPFRVVPFFDPGPWGGHWMERHFGLTEDVPNYAWCFDCVPEENSILLGYGETLVEIPAVNVVHSYPEELLGQHIYRNFGAEFPIRFDFLDTVDGGNLSLQVHPLSAYIRDHFGLPYTQDESYYMLDAAEDAHVYLGLKEGVNADAMVRELEEAQAGTKEFEVERYVNRFSARRHDHFLIPAGTVHCSGAGSMVLEISATPYIFTFKLWDWGRLGLDGRPRPIHLRHGAANIQWDRTTDWVRNSLINRVELMKAGEGWREERTGLHELQFIETRRHWFTGMVSHDTEGTVHVLNLVEGDQAVVESPTSAFDPFPIHYAETFIIPAQVGRYTIRPAGSSRSGQWATIKAFVRPEIDGETIHRKF